MKLSRKLSSFLQIAAQVGITEAAKQTRGHLHSTYWQTVVRDLLVPWIGEYPRLYREYTDSHPRFSDADPFKLMLVSPREITHTSKRSGEHLLGRVVGGNWDSPAGALRDDTCYRGLREYIRTGDPTTYNEKFEEKRRFAGWEYSSTDPVSDRLHDVDALIESFREHGYALQEEVDTDELRGDYSADRPDIVNEVTVSIGRDGTLYYNWMGGSHRLFISKIIDIERIPVQVALRHTRWQRVRDAIRRSDSVPDVPAEYRDFLAHPDIRDIHPAA